MKSPVGSSARTSLAIGDAHAVLNPSVVLKSNSVRLTRHDPGHTHVPSIAQVPGAVVASGPAAHKERELIQAMNHIHDARVVVITGASAGVGRATARAFARRGARVGLIARGRTGLAGAVRDVEDLGGSARAIEADVADHAAIEAAADAVEREFGPIDVWVNNAMVSEYAPFWQMTPDEFKHVVEVTLLGQVYGTMAALKRMRPRDSGVIVHVGSALSHRSIPLQSAYCAAKHGVNGFVESLRTELMRCDSRVRVVIVTLPGLNTPQFDWTRNKMGRDVRPVGRIYQPEVAAEAIVFASQHNRKELLVGWPTVQAVAGERIASGLVDRYVARAAWDGALEGPERPPRPDNFWQPIESDVGAHGRFDAEAHGTSLQLWINTHWKSLVPVALGVAAGLAVRMASAGRSHTTDTAAT